MKHPLISVVIPTHNQAERINLVLVGLQAQTLAATDFEVVVVDDGCTDATVEVVCRAAANGLTRLELVRTADNRGRSAARNLGIAQANGQLIVFLDGDALPAPDLLERYASSHEEHGPEAVLCGYQYCLEELEYIGDPETGALVTTVEIPSVLKDYLRSRRDQIAVTAETIRHDFDTLLRRAKPGGYPFPESAQRQDEAVRLLNERPYSQVGWLGFIPHNGAAAARNLREVGGFDTTIAFSEGWELAYRLLRRPGGRCAAVPASTCHLYHYHRFSTHKGARKEARVRYRAIEQMAAFHQDPRVRLLYCWMAHLWPDPYIPETMVVDNLLEFDRLYSALTPEQWLEYELILDHHPAEFPTQRKEARHGIPV